MTIEADANPVGFAAKNRVTEEPTDTEDGSAGDYGSDGLSDQFLPLLVA